MKKKYQIFISSTYNDLIEERRMVRDAILLIQQFPVGMEYFGASNQRQWDKIKDTIDSSDFYVLIVAHRYGSTITDETGNKISYTEMEYDYAKEKGIPILAFLIDETAPIEPYKIEDDNKDKLLDFKNKIMSERIIAKWNSPDDLAKKVISSLLQEIEKGNQPGLIRAESSHELLEFDKTILDLTNENKRLKAELSQYTNRKPLLDISFSIDDVGDEKDCDISLDNAILDEQHNLKGIKIFNSSSLDKVKTEYKRIEFDNIPKDLLEFIDKNAIKEYNDSLPNEEEMKRYSTLLDDYNRIKNGYVKVDVGFMNNGTTKANNASIEMEFPEGIDVYNDNILDIEKPYAPTIKQNPVELAIERRYRKASSCYVLKKPNNILNTDACNAIQTHGRDALVKTLKFLNKKCTIHDRKIVIEVDNLMHSKCYHEHNIYLVGTIPGEYKIKCILMCEEYAEPDVRFIDFTVK